MKEDEEKEDEVKEDELKEEEVKEDELKEDEVKEDNNTFNMSSESQTKKLNVVNALDTLVNYITDEVAKKVNLNVNVDNIQDGFNSVNKSAETMANSGGGKKNRTRKFKLTGKKQNKTKQNK